MRIILKLLLCISALWMGPAVAETLSLSAFKRPLTIPFPKSAPYDPGIATLGKMLFFDPRLSGAQNMSCASCHNPSFGWETPVKTAIGAANKPLFRHAPTVINSAWIKPLFWDGRAASLEAQAAGPITAELEMNATFPEVVARLSKVTEYAKWFDRLFPGQGITQESIVRAIATYERTVVSGWSPFDRWAEGDENAVSESAKRGFALFINEARCAACHTGWNFTDNKFHDIGLRTDDIGRADIAPDEVKAERAFKTPGLRNISLRAPYMHKGQISDLQGVVEHYARGGVKRASLAKEMQPFTLKDGQMDDLLAFLDSLTEEETFVPTPILPAN